VTGFLQSFEELTVAPLRRRRTEDDAAKAEWDGILLQVKSDHRRGIGRVLFVVILMFAAVE